MFKGTQVSWLALIGALAVAPLGTAAFGADSTTAPAAEAIPQTTPPAVVDTTATPAPERKGDDVTVVDPTTPAKVQGTLADLVPGQMTAKDLIGQSVVNANGDTIGKITDIVLDNSKAVYAVLSVGGFLGIGADYVAVPFEKIQINATGDGGSKVQIVASVTEDDLKTLASAQRGETTAEAGRSKPADETAPAADTAMVAAPDTTAPAADTTTTATATDQPATTDTTLSDTSTAPAAGTDPTQVAAVYADMTAEDLIGKTVVNTAGDKVGSIDDLVIDNQKVVMAVISVGGFLGIGAKDVAVPLEQLQLSEDKAMLTSGLTKDELEKMPAYEKGKLQGVEHGKPFYKS